MKASSIHCSATIGTKALTREEGSTRPCKKNYSCCDFFRFADTAKGMSRFQRFLRVR